MQISETSGLPIVMVPCLHQSNIYIKRNLYGCSANKYYPWVGAKRVQNFTGLQITRIHVSPYTAHNANFRNFGASYRHGTMFAPKQYLYQKEFLGCRSQKYYPWVVAKRIQASTGLQITRIHVSPYRAENANFRNFGASYCHGTVFARKQYLYQKEALGMQSRKI